MNVMTTPNLDDAEIDGLDQALADAIKADYDSCDTLADAEEAYSSRKDDDLLRSAYEAASEQNLQACKRVNEISMTIANRRWSNPRGAWLKGLALAVYGGDFGLHSAGPYERGAQYQPGGMTLDVDNSLIKSIARDAQDFSGLATASVILAQMSPEPPPPPLPPAEEAALIAMLDCELVASYIRFAQENSNAERLEQRSSNRAILDSANYAAQCASDARGEVIAKIKAANLTSQRGEALKHLAAASPYLRRLDGEFKSLFGGMDHGESLAASLAASCAELHPDLAISRMILAGDECAWADDKREPVAQIEHVLYGTETIAAVGRRKFKGVDGELLRLSATLSAIHDLQIKFHALGSMTVDCPFYEASWQHREKINAVLARTLAGVQAKKKAAEIALWGDDDRSNCGPGSYRDLTDSILADIDAIASAKTEHRSAA